MLNQKIVIVEDEINSRNLLKSIISEYCPGFEVCGEADSVAHGIKVIQETKPDILLLDIELRDGLSFQILEDITETRYKVIFITSHLHYTLKAIKLSAIDYILKPVSIDELRIALEKTQSISWNSESLDVFRKGLENEFDHLLIFYKDKYHRLSFEDIFAFESDGNYSRIYMQMTSYIVSQSLSHFEELVPDFFYRAHKSCIINCKKVKSIDSGRGGSVILRNDMEFPVAYRRKSELISRI